MTFNHCNYGMNSKVYLTEYLNSSGEVFVCFLNNLLKDSVWSKPSSHYIQARTRLVTLFDGIVSFLLFGSSKFISISAISFLVSLWKPAQ